MNPETRTIRGLRAALQNGSTTATELTGEHLARIRTHDQVPGEEINSFLSFAENRALSQAARIDELARKGDPLPPLAGVPTGIKDVLVMRGAPATAGSAILKGYHPPYDATAVARLDAAGAVLLGKLNCDEFAMGSSNENSAYGPVRNPRALDRVPGGSSGGGRRRRWRPDSAPPAWAPIREVPSGNRQPFAEWWVYCRPMAASPAMA